MRFFTIIVCLVCLGLGIPTLAQDSDEFTIKVFTGDDTEAPTTPTLQSVTAVSSNQIDLLWTVVTDNFLVGGYVIERSVGTGTLEVIATTTLNSFSDTGLSASSTYLYSVRAFDVSFNYSSSSNAITVITPPSPVATTTPSGGSGGSGTTARVVASDSVITTSETTADFSLATLFPSRFAIRWGRTASYELGFITSDILRREYRTVLTDLEPGTTYEYEIVGFTATGASNVVERGQFRTADSFDATVPANVRRFSATPEAESVELQWSMPTDPDIASVRIVRSHINFPVTPTDGALVYQGTGTSVVDDGVFADHDALYYTAFVYDKAGNISSGAVSFVVRSAPVGESGDNNLTLENGSSSDTDVRAPDPTTPPLAHTNERMPDTFEIQLLQGDTVFSFADGIIRLDSDQPLALYIPTEAVTKNLKSIIVQLQDPTDQRKTFSFLLRLNKDQSAYEAVISPLNVVGVSSLVVSVYDFRSLRVAEYRAKVEFVSMPNEIIDTSADDRAMTWQLLGLLGVIALSVIWFLLRFDRDGNEDNSNEHT